MIEEGLIIMTQKRELTTYGFIKPKCEDIGFQHLWKDVTPREVYATNPPSYPPPQRECENCGRHQTLKTIQQRIQEWRDLFNE